MMRLICLWLTVSLLAVKGVSGQDLVLTNAQIVDPTTRAIVRGALWMEAGRIVGRGVEAPAGVKGERIDLKGRWVIPGLVDLHVHSFGNTAPPNVADALGTEAVATRVLRAGVTAFLDLFGAQEDAILRLRDRQRAGEIGGAEIFSAGPCFTATNGHCSEYGITTRLIDSPEDARKQLAELAPKRPDVVKVVYDHAIRRPSIDRPTLDALIAAATQRGLKTIVHVGTWDDLRHAVLAGATAVTHVPRQSVVPDDVVALMAERRTYHIPTLAVQTDLPMLWLWENKTLMDSPMMAALTTDAIRGAYRKGVPARAPEDSAASRAVTARSIESVRRLHAAGIRMLAGTDAGNWGVIQGYSLHRELVRLVEAGLSPWEALAASTTQAGEFLGRRFGVQPGDAANFVVLDASPIDDITNTQRISMVVIRGQIVFR